MNDGVRNAASGIRLVLLTSCTASSGSSAGPAPEPFTAYVADGEGTVTVVNTVTGTVTPIHAGPFPLAIAFVSG